MSQPLRQLALGEARPPSSDQPTNAKLALGWVVVGLCVVSALALTPFWAPLLLAAWGAIIARPLYGALAKRIHRRKGAAALVTVLLVVAFLTPVLVTLLSLSGAAIDLGHRLLESKSGGEALRSLAEGGDTSTLDFRKLDTQQLVQLLQRHGASAWGVAKSLFGAATVLVVGLVVFVAAFYTLLLHGPRLHEWLLIHSPLSRPNFHRFSSAFEEVGRGLLLGVGLTALLQGLVATVGYVVCGVPQPLVLGLVTVFASLIPSVGSGLVWAPVTVGLFVAGRTGTAVLLLVVGCVVSVVDNLARPLLAKLGQLRMHGLLLFMAMLGGIAVFGAGGLLLGPLVVRLAVEGLVMLREASPTTFPRA
ncbi:MAG TPA: AI-2E family transporter [Polyangiaceae bacterium]